MARAAKRSLSNVSTGDLQRELRRRAADVRRLEAKRDKLVSEVETIDKELDALEAALGGSAARRNGRASGATRGRRRRPRNEMNLEESLVKTLKGKTMGVSEVAEAVQRGGYRTTSPNFRTIVNQTLISSGAIRRVARGQYTAK